MDLKRLACLSAAVAASIAGAAPTSRCNATPWMRLVQLYAPTEARERQILATVADPRLDPSFFDFLGNPIRATRVPSSDSPLTLQYDPAQDVREIAERLASNNAFAQDFSRIYADGYSVCFSPPPGPLVMPLTEYHNELLDHYFISSSQEENEILDRGGAGPGWVRTGQAWTTHYPRDCGTRVRGAVYRFYGPGPNSHFFTAGPEECGGLRNGQGWLYEGLAFGAEVPVDGVCPANAPLRVFRTYNNRWVFNDSNHRYTTDPAIYEQMISRGWAGEGVALCLPDLSR